MLEKYTQKGSISGTPVEIFFQPSLEQTNKVTFITKGMYGVFDPEDSASKVRVLGNKLTTSGCSHVVYHNSSRAFSCGRDASFQRRKEAFLDKSFEEELADLQIVIETVLKKATSIFDIVGKPKIYMHGNSLGGTLSILATKNTAIEKLSLCAPPMSTNGSSKPLLSTFPDTEVLAKALRSYTGELLVFRGGKDTTVPQKSVRYAYDAAQDADRTYKEIPGISHSFSKKDGVEDESAPTIFSDIVFNFFNKNSIK